MLNSTVGLYLSLQSMVIFHGALILGDWIKFMVRLFFKVSLCERKNSIIPYNILVVLAFILEIVRKVKFLICVMYERAYLFIGDTRSKGLAYLSKLIAPLMMLQL
jgi:hypothetical protein